MDPQQKPVLSTYRVVDNLYASLWASYVLDLETVVGDFQYVDCWDYKSFKNIADKRGIARVHRRYAVKKLDLRTNTFSLFLHSSCTSTTATDKRSKGKFAEQFTTYKTLMNIIFNAAKTIWNERGTRRTSLGGGVIELKRNVCGLYLLYYLWHNQIPADDEKILINLTADDELDRRLFFERISKFSPIIPDFNVLERCCKFITMALDARNAWNRCYVSDEPKLDFQYWEYLNLKCSTPRVMMSQIASRCHKPQLVKQIQESNGRILLLLNELKTMCVQLLEHSILLRKILPKDVLMQFLLYESQSLLPVSVTMPIDYQTMAISTSTSINKSISTLQQPFLSLDSLMKSLNASTKLSAVGQNAAENVQKRSAAAKLKYEKRRAQYNKVCKEVNLQLLVRGKHKYRSMDSPVWNFIRRRVGDIFSTERTNPAPRSYEMLEINPVNPVKDDKVANVNCTDTEIELNARTFDLEDALVRRKRHRNLPLIDSPTTTPCAHSQPKRQRTSLRNSRSLESLTSLSNTSSHNLLNPQPLHVPTSKDNNEELKSLRLEPLKIEATISPIIENASQLI